MLGAHRDRRISYRLAALKHTAHGSGSALHRAIDNLNDLLEPLHQALPLNFERNLTSESVKYAKGRLRSDAKLRTAAAKTFMVIFCGGLPRSSLQEAIFYSGAKAFMVLFNGIQILSLTLRPCPKVTKYHRKPILGL
jgi:copper homeostasis protein CutC